VNLSKTTASLDIVAYIYSPQISSASGHYHCNNAPPVMMCDCHCESRFLAMSFISLKIEFGGGLELLFSNQRTHAVTVPSHVPVDNRTEFNLSQAPDNSNLTPVTETKPADITYLIHHMRDHLLKEREELFMENGTVYVVFFHHSSATLIPDRSSVVRAYSS
jgi:hypothetical protein